MLRCWLGDPTGRPNFQELSTEFQQMLDDSKVIRLNSRIELGLFARLLRMRPQIVPFPD